MCRSCYYLFIIEAEKFSVTDKRPFFSRLKKTNTDVYICNNLFTSMEEMIDSFLWNQHKPFKATTWNSSKKVIYKSQLLRSLQRWYKEATLLYHRFISLLRGNSDAINQSNLRNFSAYIIIIVINPIIWDVERTLEKLIKRIPFKVRAITCKNYLLKIYSEHVNFLNAI